MELLKRILLNAKISAYLNLCAENFYLRDSREFEKSLRNYSFIPFSGILPKTPS